MCGIAGFTHVVRRLPEGVLDSALHSIVHRGPDQQGRFKSEQVSLGATRLRILDLAAGDQPLKSPDGDVVLVFNGEIFNHQELRSELQRVGFFFHTRCDTEVVLNAFLRWGERQRMRERPRVPPGFREQPDVGCARPARTTRPRSTLKI